MDSIVVHPVEGSSWDSVRLEFTFHVRVIDAVTGELIQSAYAEKPVPDKAVLEARGVHPFRVLKERDVEFTDKKKVINFKFKVRTLRTFEKDPAASTGGKKALKESWKVAPEFFQPHTDKEILASADGKTVFVHIDAPTEQYVRLKEAASPGPYAERALITDRNGVLLIPLTFRQWVEGTTLTLKFRDWVILAAKDDFSIGKLMDKETKAGGPVSNFGHKAMKIALEGEPLTNTWTATVGTAKGTFQSEISVATEWTSENVHLTLWALRRIKPLTDVMPAADIANGSGNNSRQGIMIHYNSGYFMWEHRPDEDHRVPCPDAYNAGDNRYALDVKIAMGILKYLNGASKRYGYNYHIEQEGTILLAVAENLRIWHAGNSREKTSVDAVENVDANPRNTTTTITTPKTNLNSSYIGIDLLGNHAEVSFRFSARQHWYLDRLIENIRSRINTLPWYRIQGHDEVRASYNSVAATPDDAKLDPGAAIDGMAKLRGRHGATFP